jgi:hypothetical protein
MASTVRHHDAAAVTVHARRESVEATPCRDRDGPPGTGETASPGLQSAVDELSISRVLEGIDIPE